MIGGGVHGTATMYHLARKGLKVALVERKHLGAGASGKSSALVRMHYTVPEEAQLAWESWKYFYHWDEIVGGDCGFVRVGFARLTSRSQQENLKKNVELLSSLGVKNQLITAQELQEIDPDVSVDDVDFAAYEPYSGYADPSSTWSSLLQAGRRMGVEYLAQTTVEQVLLEGDRVVGVRTDKGTISSPAVVVAAGNGSRRLCAGVGVDLPVWPFYIKVAFFQRPSEMSKRHLIYIDGPNKTYFRPEGSSLTLIGGSVWDVKVDDPDTDTTSIDIDFLSEIGGQLAKRFPIMEKAGARGGQVGYDAMSADGHPIFGKVERLQGFYVQTGMSGTGFKISPAVGKAMAELIVEGRWAEVNCDIFSPERFRTGAKIRGPYDYKGDGHGPADDAEAEHGL
ncbi:MAG: FAD-binding oxidoreductase [Chloroflexi bacterium]|nr:FAD-binding oxidoreductase [Chloroflexota bacterium]